MAGEPFDVELAEIALPFRLIDAGPHPGEAAAAEFARSWPSYRRWFLQDGETDRPTYREGRAALQAHLPELLPDYDAYVAAVGGGDLEARFLSHWCPPASVAACSIALLGEYEPLLVRNYDYPPTLSDTLALRTHWSGRTILGMADCGWGLMDGINDHGLAIAIAFGGRRVVGPGFGIGIAVRLLLQSASTADEAAQRLARIPIHMAYNVAILDAAGQARVVHVSPDRPAIITQVRSVANRQGETEWPEHAAYCRTVEREECLAALVANASLTRDDVVRAFLNPPLYRPLDASTWGTVYTAAYSPAALTATLLWPDDHWPVEVLGHSTGEHPRVATALLPVPVERVSPIPRPEPLAVVL